MQQSSATKPVSDLYSERLARINKAVALEKPDRVPVVPLGDSFAANVIGMPLSRFCTDPQSACEAMIKAFTSLGDFDGIQHASYNVNLLSVIWLSKIDIPGRDLPDDALWQVKEIELMAPEEYDTIINGGFGPWLDDFYKNRLDNLGPKFGQFVQALPGCMQAWRDLGIVPYSPIVFTIPYELFCGARSFPQFIFDLSRRPDKVQAAMDAAMPTILEQARQVCRGFKPHAVWVGGWRAASEYLRSAVWERFVFPYYQQLIQAVVEEGVTPVLHFDSNWTRDLERFRTLPKAKCVLSLDGQTDIFKAKQVLGDHMCIMGDVHPELLTMGNPERVTEYCKRLIKEVGPNGFIMAQGCDIPPDAKPENVRAMIESVHRFS